jgi:S-adenosylmethionine-diacylglycerol 3-amino-3-carboxypropyl transferase
MTALAGVAGLGRGLLYSQCWEDVEVARAALRITPGATVLTIGAAGDNTLALLQDDPGRVLAVDVNPSQTALVQLKIAAIRHLDDAVQVGRFLGAAFATDRTASYERLRPALLPEVRQHWDAHQPMIEDGVIHAGRFERHLAGFRRAVLPMVPGRRAVRKMLRSTCLEEQRRVYREDWDSWRWRLLFRLSFSRWVLERLGRDPAFFAQCEIESVGSHYLARARHALVDLPIWCNPYLTYMLSGRLGTGQRSPDYLRPNVQALARARLGRVEVHTASLDDVLRDLPSRSVDAFYLSDVFELSTPADYESTLAEIARTGRPGARICYWNNLVPRCRPASLADRILRHPDEANTLHARDRAFLYSALVVESVGGLHP